MSSITTSYSAIQMTRVAIFSLVLGGGIAYLFLTNKAAKEKAAKEKAAKEKAAKEKWERERPAREEAAREKADKEMKIATKLGVAVDKIVSKSLFCFCSFFSHTFLLFCSTCTFFFPCGFVLLLSILILTFFSVHILLLIYFSLLSYNRSLFTQENI
jgi:hypothetical protein